MKSDAIALNDLLYLSLLFQPSRSIAMELDPMLNVMCLEKKDFYHFSPDALTAESFPDPLTDEYCLFA